MQFGNITIENSLTIERRFRVLNAINAVLVLFAFIGTLILLFFIFTNFHLFHSRISVWYPGIHFMLFLSIPVAFTFINNLELLTHIKTKHIGVYKTEWIVELCDTVIKENFDEKEETPSIYLGNTLPGYAFAINSLLLNSVKELNAITISRELFSFLNIDELKSVIAHEIGHFKYYMSIAKRIPFLPFLFIILSSYSLTAMLIPILEINGFVLYTLCFLFIKLILRWPFQLFKHDVELLSDLYSAKKYGMLNMVNALIKTYQMDNIDILLNVEISKFIIESDYLQIKDMEILRKELRRKLSKKIYDENLILQQVKTYLNNMSYTHQKALSYSARKKRDRALHDYLKRISKMIDNKTLNWNDLDNHKEDGRIDSIEYAGFIEALKRNPELQLFRSPHDNIRKMRFGTHPTLRERILFLDQNCSELHETTNDKACSL